MFVQRRLAPHPPGPISFPRLWIAAVLACAQPTCASPGSRGNAAAADADTTADAASVPDAGGGGDVGAMAGNGDAAGVETAAGAPSDASANTSSDAAAPDPFVAPPEWTACSADADCYALPLSCCDACNGGAIGAFHNKFVETAKPLVVPKKCASVSCGTQPCGSPIAVCEAGQCAAIVDPGFAGGCADLGPALCHISPSCKPIYAQPASAAACGGVGPSAMPTLLGCGQADSVCSAAPTCGQGAGGARAIFGNSCLAAGWTAAAMASCCDAALCPSGGAAAAIGRMCLKPIAPATSLQPGAPFAVVVWPKGCYASSCTKVFSATCGVTAQPPGYLHVGAAVCLEDTSSAGQACTDDCGGGGSAECPFPGLPAGTYKAMVGTWTMKFSVPSSPGQPLCADAP